MSIATIESSAKVFQFLIGRLEMELKLSRPMRAFSVSIPYR